MKTTTIILFLLLVLLGSTSCEQPNIENSVKNPKEFTTVAMQELHKDTVVIAFDDLCVYHFSGEEVVLQTKVVEDGWMVISKVEFTLVLVFLFICTFLIALLTGITTASQ